MNGDTVKNPDYLLTLVKKQETRGNQGRLKVFLGMVAGVGKTYSMLQAAHRLKAQGIDVVVGVIETHGRPETAALLPGIEQVPKRKLSYRGIEIEELDTDAVLKRKPEVVLVDELAHTNAPGSRHNKRYLDVYDLLEAGIHVYTTVNVQHLESRVDTVREITQVTVQETVPDSVLDRADEVVLIDLPPEELLRRLQEGRVYPKESADIASKHFFQKGNLTALREIALRVAAERVDRELREYKTMHGIEDVWKAGGRLMVAVFASPYSEILIRWTRRVADLLGVSWIGAYVENDEGISEDEKKLLAKNISLVQQLGGEVVSTRDDDTVNGLLRVAYQNNVTQIIVGKSHRRAWQNLFSGGSIVTRLLRNSGNIDVYAVSTDRAKTRRHQKKLLIRRGKRLPWEQLGSVFAIAMLTWLVSAGLAPFIGYAAVGIIFLLAVTLSGLFLARFAVLSLAFIFAMIHNFFFIPPLYTFTISKPEDIMMLLTYFAAAAIIGHLTTRLSDKERILQAREARTTTLYNLAKDIAAAQSTKEILDRACAHLESAIDAQVVFLMRHNNRKEQPSAVAGHWFSLPAKEAAVGAWVLKNGKLAGRGTETLSASEGIFIPVVGKSEIIGVLGVKLKNGLPLQPEQLTLVESFLHQIASGIERETYHGKASALQAVEKTQKLYSALLDSVSHELKTPLAIIKGSASALTELQSKTNQPAVESLSQEILRGSNRLERLVNNLLDMTRIESGMIQPRQDLCDVSDIIGTVLNDIEPQAASRVKVHLQSNLPPVLCDPVLTDQAIANIIRNAVTYTPADQSIEIYVQQVENKTVELQIRDHGPGLPRENPEVVFDKFYRGDPHKPGGVGLGLSISKGFIEAQGGRIVASNADNGGAVFSISFSSGDRV